MTCIACLFRSWGVLTIQHEYELLLSVDEFAHYSDPRYGSDKRFLALIDVAPTVLHSYGNALDPCPCSCRASKFSVASLLTKGLRGFFVNSERWNQPRYLHPKELRRHQSYGFAAHANSQACSAVAYRLELWAAILRAPGFESSFAVWWSQHASQSDIGAPHTLPVGPPGAAVAKAIFRHLKRSFETFENWHHRQRSNTLRLKYDHSMDALLKELRDSKGASLQLLEYRHEYTVEIVDVAAGVVFVDRQVSVGGSSTWVLDGAVISFVDGLLLAFLVTLPGWLGRLLCNTRLCPRSQMFNELCLIFGHPNGRPSRTSLVNCGIVCLTSLARACPS